MTATDVDALAAGLVPVLRDIIDEAIAPVVARLAALEAQPSPVATHYDALDVITDEAAAIIEDGIVAAVAAVERTARTEVERHLAAIGLRLPVRFSQSSLRR